MGQVTSSLTHASSCLQFQTGADYHSHLRNLLTVLNNVKKTVTFLEFSKLLNSQRSNIRYENAMEKQLARISEFFQLDKDSLENGITLSNVEITNDSVSGNTFNISADINVVLRASAEEPPSNFLLLSATSAATDHSYFGNQILCLSNALLPTQQPMYFVLSRISVSVKDNTGGANVTSSNYDIIEVRIEALEGKYLCRNASTGVSEIPFQCAIPVSEEKPVGLKLTHFVSQKWILPDLIASIADGPLPGFQSDALPKLKLLLKNTTNVAVNVQFKQILLKKTSNYIQTSSTYYIGDCSAIFPNASHRPIIQLNNDIKMPVVNLNITKKKMSFESNYLRDYVTVFSVIDRNFELKYKSTSRDGFSINHIVNQLVVNHTKSLSRVGTTSFSSNRFQVSTIEKATIPEYFKAIAYVPEITFFFDNSSMYRSIAFKLTAAQSKQSCLQFVLKTKKHQEEYESFVVAVLHGHLKCEVRNEDCVPEFVLPGYLESQQPAGEVVFRRYLPATAFEFKPKLSSTTLEMASKHLSGFHMSKYHTFINNAMQQEIQFFLEERRQGTTIVGDQQIQFPGSHIGSNYKLCLVLYPTNRFATLELIKCEQEAELQKDEELGERLHPRSEQQCQRVFMLKFAMDRLELTTRLLEHCDTTYKTDIVIHAN